MEKILGVGEQDCRELYADLVEDSAMGVIIAEKATRKVLYANRQACTFIGIKSIEEIHGQLKEFLQQEGRQLLLSEEEVAALRPDGYTELHKRGTEKYLMCRCKSIQLNGVPCYVAYLSDESETITAKLQLQKFINHVPTGIAIYEISPQNVTLLYINDSYFEMLGATRQERKDHLGANTLMAVYHEDKAKVMALVERILQGDNTGSVMYREEIPRRGMVWISCQLSVFERMGHTVKIYATFSNCTEIVKNQEALEAARKREKTLLAGIPGGVAIYALKKDGRIVPEYVSHGLAKMFGYASREEFFSVIKDDVTSSIEKEDLPHLMANVEKALRTGNALSTEYRIYTKQGDILFQRLEANVIDDNDLQPDERAKFYCVKTKVSEEGKLALAEQERYRTILNNLGMAFLEVEIGKQAYASEKYYNYALSSQSFDAIATNTGDISLVHPDDVEVMHKFAACVERKEPKASCIVRLKMKDGSFKWTEILSFNYFDKKGAQVRVVGILRDIDKERIEENKYLQQALKEAQAANKAKTVFLSRMSHDMRTPLNGILGLTDLIRNNSKDRSIIPDLNDLDISGQYLLSLINDTLDMSKIESGKIELRPIVCEGYDILTSIIKLAKPNIQAKNIDFKVDTDKQSFNFLYVDKNRFSQILMNIIGNATKFTPEGGTIEFKAENISLKDGVSTEKIIISDTGIGMSKEFIPHIFEAFSQEDNTTNNSYQGTGLGMAITKKLIELMDGTIEVESEVGKGTTFTLIVKLQVATEEQVALWKKEQQESFVEMSFSGKRLLVCEDHPINAKLIVKTLESKDAQVELASNGACGVQMFAQSQPGYYDAILMDIRMPVMDGLTATKEIRALERPDAMTLPIIAMTANVFDDDIAQIKAAGMNAHVSKPVDKKMLFRTLNSFLKVKRRKRQHGVLIVDDIEVNREVLKLPLESSYYVAEAENGQEALNVLHRDNTIDIVITDIQMPHMDGMELIKRIRQDFPQRKLIIIANTQFGDCDQEEKLLSLGADDFIYKPSTPKIVEMRVHNALGKL